MKNQYLDVQGLRAIAVLFVIAYHAGLPIPGGFAGVDIFFVVSGYVITHTLMSEFSKNRKINLARFYERRVKRLFPALALLIFSVFLVSVFIESPFYHQSVTSNTGLAAILFSANAYLFETANAYFTTGSHTNPLLHTWSLSVEEQFYFVYPWLIGLVLARGLAKKRNPRVYTLKVIGLVALLSFTLSIANHLFGHVYTLESRAREFCFYASPLRAWEFLAGAILVLSLPRNSEDRKRIPRWLSVGFSVLSVGLLLASAFGMSNNTPFPGFAVLVPVAGTALAIFTGTFRKNFLTSFLQLRPLVWIGDISYSLYLWHWPLGVFASALYPENPAIRVLATCLSVLPAWLSYQYVEQPIRNSSVVRGRKVIGLFALCLAVPVTAALVLRKGAESFWGVKRFADLGQTRAGAFEREYRQCHRLKGEKEYGCTFNVPGAFQSAYLIGDSHAAAVSGTVAKAAQALGINLTIRTSAGCPFAYVNLAERCSDFWSTSIAKISAMKPDLVIIVNNSLNADLYGPGEERWVEGLRRAIEDVRKYSRSVLIFQTVPGEFKKDIMSCTRLVGEPNDCGALDRADAIRQREDAIQKEAKLAQEIDSIHLFDPFNLICPDTPCRQVVNGRAIYYDRDHLSSLGADMILDEIKEAMTSSLGNPSNENAHSN